MPNHVQNWIHAEAPVMARIRNLLCDAKGPDFNRLIRMPKSTAVFKADGGISREDEEQLGREFTWYGWAVKYWGTKWNAYATKDDRNDERNIWFQTAWSMPKPIFFALAARQPGPFSWAWADQDFGHNLGIWKLELDGVYVSPTMPGLAGCDADVAMRWAMELHDLSEDEQREYLSC